MARQGGRPRRCGPRESGEAKEIQTISPITVLIVDDHTVAREGLRAMIETDPQVQVIGEAADGRQALDQVARLRPNVVLMDIKMPNLDGLEATRRIKEEHPFTAVIMLTSYDDEPLVVDAVRAGAAGYLLKDVSRDLLSHTIGAVASGGMLIKASLLRRAIAGVAFDRVPRSTEADDLTQREHEVLKLLAEGRTNKDIGEALALAEVTVKKHVQGLMGKLHASDRTDAAIKGLRMGIIK